MKKGMSPLTILPVSSLVTEAAAKILTATGGTGNYIDFNSAASLIADSF